MKIENYPILLRHLLTLSDWQEKRLRQRRSHRKIRWLDRRGKRSFVKLHLSTSGQTRIYLSIQMGAWKYRFLG